MAVVLAKRLRAARKRLRNIEDVERKRDAGQAINTDQVGVPASAHHERTALVSHC